VIVKRKPSKTSLHRPETPKNKNFPQMVIPLG